MSELGLKINKLRPKTLKAALQIYCREYGTNLLEKSWDKIHIRDRRVDGINTRLWAETHKLAKILAEREDMTFCAYIDWLINVALAHEGLDREEILGSEEDDE